MRKVDEIKNLFTSILLFVGVTLFSYTNRISEDNQPIRLKHNCHHTEVAVIASIFQFGPETLFAKKDLIIQTPAEQALYTAKDSGRNRALTYHKEEISHE